MTIWFHLKNKNRSIISLIFEQIYSFLYNRKQEIQNNIFYYILIASLLNMPYTFHKSNRILESQSLWSFRTIFIFFCFHINNWLLYHRGTLQDIQYFNDTKIYMNVHIILFFHTFINNLFKLYWTLHKIFSPQFSIYFTLVI